MAFPTGALLHRLREHGEMPWAAYMPARFRDDAAAKAGVFGSAPPGAGGAPGQFPSSRLLGQLPSRGSVAGRVWRLSRDAAGCRQVQQALDEASDEEREALVEELRGHIWDAIRCPHANHVIQKCVAVLEPRSLQVIVDEVMDGRLVQAARHKYGCRIVQRLLENCTTEQVRPLVETLLQEFLEISRHSYGTFVMQKLLNHVVEDEEQQNRLVGLVERHVSDLALHPHGCAVLGAALEHGTPLERRRLADMVLEDRSLVAFTVDTRHGYTIVTRLLGALDDSGCEQLMGLLEGNPKLEEIVRRRSEGESSESGCRSETACSSESA